MQANRKFHGAVIAIYVDTQAGMASAHLQSQTCTVEAIERKISTAMRKSLGAPLSVSDVALYCKKEKLVFPFKTVTEEYKAGKVHFSMMLHESVDPKVQKTP